MDCTGDLLSVLGLKLTAMDPVQYYCQRGGKVRRRFIHSYIRAICFPPQKRRTTLGISGKKFYFLEMRPN